MLGLGGGGGGGGGGGNGGGNGLGVGASSAESSPAPSEVPRRRGRPQALEPLLCGRSEEGSDTPCAATPTAPGSAVIRARAVHDVLQVTLPGSQCPLEERVPCASKPGASGSASPLCVPCPVAAPARW